MTKKRNPNGRVSIDLFSDKPELDRQAASASTTCTALARILIRDGLGKLARGEVTLTPPSLTPTEEVEP